MVYILLGPQAYHSFVLDAGWSPQEWITWTANALVRDLYAGRP